MELVVFKGGGGGKENKITREHYCNDKAKNEQ